MIVDLCLVNLQGLRNMWHRLNTPQEWRHVNRNHKIIMFLFQSRDYFKQVFPSFFSLLVAKRRQWRIRMSTILRVLIRYIVLPLSMSNQEEIRNLRWLHLFNLFILTALTSLYLFISATLDWSTTNRLVLETTKWIYFRFLRITILPGILLI